MCMYQKKSVCGSEILDRRGLSAPNLKYLSPPSSPTLHLTQSHHAPSNRRRNQNSLHQTSKLYRPLFKPAHRPPAILLVLLGFLHFRPPCLPPACLTGILHASLDSQPGIFGCARKSALARHMSRKIHQDGEISIAHHGVGYHCAACAVQGVGQTEWRDAVSVRGQCGESACGKME